MMNNLKELREKIKLHWYNFQNYYIIFINSTVELYLHIIKIIYIKFC